MSTGPIKILRADVPPLGEIYEGASVHVLPTGELVTLDIEFYRSTKTRAILTIDQARKLRAQLNDAIGKASYCVLERQQREACPTCNGRGWMPETEPAVTLLGRNPCKDCNGTGEAQS